MTDNVVRDLTGALAEPVHDPSGHLQARQARLAAQAAQAGILDIAYRTLDTPVGPLLLAATERGLVRTGGYLGGPEAKRILLALEAAA
jgi:methylated-DNA-[protein]-cysteine S-methyltransferase